MKYKIGDIIYHKSFEPHEYQLIVLDSLDGYYLTRWYRFGGVLAGDRDTHNTPFRTLENSYIKLTKLHKVMYE